jgi:hypothetical protein
MCNRMQLVLCGMQNRAFGPYWWRWTGAFFSVMVGRDLMGQQPTGSTLRESGSVLE